MTTNELIQELYRVVPPTDRDKNIELTVFSYTTVLNENPILDENGTLVL